MGIVGPISATVADEKSSGGLFSLEQQRRAEDGSRISLLLPFQKGCNPKWGNDQWEARQDGQLFVLRREDRYDSSEGSVIVVKLSDLVPGKIILVGRVRIAH